jgi:hypothetical protein
MNRTSRLGLAFVLLLCGTPAAAQKDARATLHDAMRKLWSDHVSWTRMFIISAVHGLPDKDATTQRLLRNQDDIGAAMGQYYGKAAGDKTAALLRDHILIAADLVGAAKAGDQAKAGELTAKWRRNAEDIADLLSTANPRHWKKETIRTMLYTHLDQTVAEATHRIQGNYAADVTDYEAALTHMLMLADALSDGIIHQFPQKFTGRGTAGR